MHHERVLSTYRLNSHRKGDEHPAYTLVRYGPPYLYAFSVSVNMALAHSKRIHFDTLSNNNKIQNQLTTND